MKFAICNETFQNWKLADVLTWCAKAGYDGVEVAPFTLCKHVTDVTAGERERIRESAARAGIAISGIHWVLAQTEGMYLTSPDAATRERTAQYFCELVDFCADIGGKFIVVGSPKQRNLLPGVTCEQAWAWATDVFRLSVKRAEERGVVICFEPLATTETNFVNTAEEGIRFARQFASPAMSVILDVKAMCSMGKPVPQIIRESRGGFAYFHANDANLKGPGFGDVDFRPIAAALRDAGYAGWVSVEVFNYDEGPGVIATKSLEYLQRSFA